MMEFLIGLLKIIGLLWLAMLGWATLEPVIKRYIEGEVEMTETEEARRKAVELREFKKAWIRALLIIGAVVIGVWMFLYGLRQPPCYLPDGRRCPQTWE